jgi:hypothetical protein
MNLSAEQFEHIIAALRSDAICGRNAEQRAAPRVGMRMQVSVALLNNGAAITRHQVRVRDISITGIGLLASEEIQIGTYFAVHFAGRDDGVTVLYQVVRSQAVGEKMYQVGASFVQYLNAAGKN